MVRPSFLRTLTSMVMGLFAVATAMAGDFNPTNPPDPMATYQLTLTTEPQSAGYVSGGSKYSAGQQVWVSTSARANYEFVEWRLDGQTLSTSSSFYYTTTNHPQTLVAYYRFNPNNPADPQMPNLFRLYLETDQAGSCTFNRVSGAKTEGGQQVWVAVQNVTAYYRFVGWYVGDEQVSTSSSFYYTMPKEDVTLTARFVYDPASPTDPNSGQQDIDNTEPIPGDVNGDGKVNVGDIMAVINIMAGQGGNNAKGDVNEDGKVNVGDIMAVINIMAGK